MGEQFNQQQIQLEINLSDHNQMMIRESTMKYDNQTEISDIPTLLADKKLGSTKFNISVGQANDEKPLYTQQESLKEIDKFVRQLGYTKSDTTLSQEHDLGSKYSRSKYTYNDLQSNFTAALQTNDLSFIRKGALLDPEGNTYGALNLNTGHFYAIKTIYFDNKYLHQKKYKKEDILEGFAIDQEVADKWIEISQKCKNLCKCYSITQQDSGIEIIYEHISGESLQKIISSFNNFQEKLIAIFARQIFKGLDFLHSLELVHGYQLISFFLIMAKS